MTDYSNLLQAVKQADKPTIQADTGLSQSKPYPTTSQGLSLEIKAKNYRLFDELMKQGVDLSALLEKANNPPPQANRMDPEVFSIMENSVKDDDGVKSSKQKLYQIKSEIINRICLQDQAYSEALQEYRNAVNTAYVKQKEKKTE